MELALLASPARKGPMNGMYRRKLWKYPGAAICPPGAGAVWAADDPAAGAALAGAPFAAEAPIVTTAAFIPVRNITISY